MLSSKFLSRTAAYVLVSFIGLTVVEPTIAAVQVAQASTPANPVKVDPYAAALDDIKEQLAQHQLAQKSPAIRSAVLQRLKRLAGLADNVSAQSALAKLMRDKRKDLDAQDSAVDADFAATEQHLLGKGLPAEIIQRHRDAVAQFKSKRVELKAKLDALANADKVNDDNQRQTAINDLNQFIQSNQQGKTHSPVDPNKLPWGTPSNKVRAPIETESGFKRNLSLLGVKPLMLAGPIPAGTALPTLGSLPTTPGADDLAETEDIQLTPAIRAKAAELGNHPVKIYNWVRNNIEFIPSYGSIQGADMTLQTGRGNAFDTSSLLIALLRAANIPARYAYGTVQLPAEQVMNWVGGVKAPEAALNLLGQGGIPSVGLTQGGQIKAVKLEHVWVEAFVDYVPSRGAVNKVGDTWIPLDASFKQYQFKTGMNLKTAVPFDAQGFVEQIKQGATINDSEGWVQGINQSAIQSQLQAYQQQVKTYIDNQNPSATVGDVLGSKTIVARNDSILLGSLPYRKLADAGQFTAIPDGLRHQFQFNLYANNNDVALENPTLSFKRSLPQLAGKKLTLSFAPATQADADTIASYLPKPHADGSPIQPSELPSSLPGYLIKLTAELNLDGQTIASGGNFMLGEELISSGGMYSPASGWQFGENARPVAGEYTAIGIDLQGVSPAQLTALKTRLTNTKTKLEAKDFAGLSKDDLAGDILHTAITSYFAATSASSKLAARASGMVAYSNPSFGYFHITSQTNYWMGLPKQVSFPGVTIDIKRLQHLAVAPDNSNSTFVAFAKQLGTQNSAYEHLIPEKLFTDPNDTSKPEGVSAVKALAVAAAQGQKIYTITQSNMATALPKLNVGSAITAEIQNAVSAGKEVTVHEAKVTINGWQGAGYIVADPETGAAAYKIGSGENGGRFVVGGVAILALGGLQFQAIGLGLALSVALMTSIILLGFTVLSIGMAMGYDEAQVSGQIYAIAIAASLPNIALQPIMSGSFAELLLRVVMSVITYLKNIDP